jgi:hypothetical protein
VISDGIEPSSVDDPPPGPIAVSFVRAQSPNRGQVHGDTHEFEIWPFPNN